MTSEPSRRRTRKSGGLTSSAAASPARTSASAEKDSDSPGSDPDFGANTPGSFAWFDPATSSWRTFQRCFLEGWASFSGTWPRAGMTRSGIAFRLSPLAPRTSATESFLWPTPAAKEPGINPERIVDKDGNTPTHPNQRLYDRHTGRLVQDGLTQAVGLWPTPNVPNGGRAVPDDAEWSTLRCAYRADGKKIQVGLNSAVKKVEGRGQLNPTWVEWLMGFPPGWTDLADSGTPSCPKSPSGSAAA